jgi:GNAT superfamily N-acetyltransferase
MISQRMKGLRARMSRRSRQPDRVFLFIHIPKCAGTSVIQALSAVPDNRRVIVSQSPGSKSMAMRDLQREISRRKIDPKTLELIMGHDVFFGMHEISNQVPYYFTFLRDPIERYVSHFRYLADCAVDPQHRLHGYAKELLIESRQLLSFEDYCRRQHMSNLMTHYLAAAGHCDRHTKRWQIQDQREVWDRAEAALRKLDMIGFVDDLATGLTHLCTKLQIPISVPRINPSQAATVRIESEQVMEMVRNNNELDLRLYKLARQLRVRRLSS